MTALICLGILPIEFLQNSSDILRFQINLIGLIRARIFGRSFSATLFLRTVQKFSIGSRLGLFHNHFRREILLAPKKSVSMNDSMGLHLA